MVRTIQSVKQSTQSLATISLKTHSRVSQEIMEALQMETGIDSRTLWVQWSGTSTLWEVKQIQENANIRFGLDTINQEIADKEFWRDIWYRSYKEYFSRTDKKFIRIANSLDGTRLLELNKRRLPHIRRPSRNHREQKEIWGRTCKDCCITRC